jgi:hypothetical protein
MIRRYRLVLLAALTVVLNAIPGDAQRLTTTGTDFWCGFMEAAGSVELRVYITSMKGATGTISMPRAGWSQSFTLSPNSSTIILPPVALAHTIGSEQVQGTGIHVVADDSVSVYALSYAAGSADATIVLPTVSLGMVYRAIAYNSIVDYDATVGDSINYPSEVLIVAPEDGVTVEVTPAMTTRSGRPAGVPFSVTLNAGEAYQVQCPGDITGSLVRSTNGKPFALFSGNKFTRVGFIGGVECGFADHLVEQDYPLNSWGKEFITVPLLTRRLGDIFRVLGSEDGTTFTIDGGPPIALNAGQYFDTLLENSSHIVANRPVCVAQYSRGKRCDFVRDGDPFMIVLNPVEQTLQSVTYNAITSDEIDGYYLSLVARTSDIGTVMIDGASPAAGTFAPVPADPSYSYAQLSVAAGNHSLSSDCGLIAYVYGYGNAVSYGYAAGASIEPIADTTIAAECSCQGLILTAPASWVPRWSTGDTTQSIAIRKPGEYSVTLANRWGCNPPPGPQKFTVTQLSPERVDFSPATMEAGAGESVSLDLALHPAQFNVACTHDSLNATLRFNRTLLVPDDIQGGTILGDTIIANDRYLFVRIPSDSLAHVQFVAALGNAESTVITLDPMAFGECLPAVAGTPLATFHLSGICRQGGTRLFEANDSLYLKPVRPDPASAHATVEYGLVEPGWTEMFLTDGTGKRVATLVEGELGPGGYRVEFDASRLASGFYNCVLRTRSQMVQRSMRVVR